MAPTMVPNNMTFRFYPLHQVLIPRNIFPSTKKVALTPYLARVSNACGVVAGFGPSSRLERQLFDVSYQSKTGYKYRIFSSKYEDWITSKKVDTGKAISSKFSTAGLG